MNKIITNIHLLLLVMFIVSCTNDDIINDSPTDKNGVNVSISLELPKSFKTITRASSTEDAIVQKPIILLMQNNKFHSLAEVEESNSAFSYKAVMDYETSKNVNKFIVLANCNINDIDFQPKEGESTLEEIINGYKFTAPVKIEDGLPMWGEATYNRSISSVKIELERAIASIDLKISKDIEGFKLENVYVGNHNEYGYYLNNPKKASSFENRIEASKSFEVAENRLKEEIYLSEVDMSNLKDDENPTTIIIEGIYNNQPGFYRVDFLQDKKESKYFSIVRNYKYEFTVTSIKGIGWSTLEQAIANKASNNIEYDLLTWMPGITQMWEQDGKYLAIAGKELLFSTMTTRINPERYICQTNIEAKNFKFESDDNLFSCDVTKSIHESNIVFVDFYPTHLNKNDEKPALKNIETVNSFNGTLSVENAAFKVDLNFKRHKDYLEVHDIDANLFGKYIKGQPTNSETDYIELKVDYRVDKHVSMKIRTGGNEDGDKFGFEGVIELDPTTTTTTAKLVAYGTPYWEGPKNIEVDFGTLHTNSPISKFKMEIYSLEEDEFRPVKILFVTKNGGENGGIYSLITDGSLFGKGGKFIKTSGDLEISYAKNFPLDKYMDYHVIYYFDSASPYQVDKPNNVGISAVEDSKSFSDFTTAAKKFTDAGKAFIYCSDDRYNGSLSGILYQETVSWKNIYESQVFINRIINKNIEFKTHFKQLADVVLHKNIEGDKHDPTESMNFDGDERSQFIYINMSEIAINAFFDVSWSVADIIPIIGTTYYPLILSPKFHTNRQTVNFTWVGSSRALSGSEWVGKGDLRRLNKNGEEFCKLVEKAAKEADLWDKDYNRPNKKRDFIEVDSSSTITKHEIYVHYANINAEDRVDNNTND